MKIFIFFVSVILGFYNIVSAQSYDITYHKKRQYVLPKKMENPALEKRIKASVENTVRVFRLQHYNGKSKYYIDHVLLYNKIDKDPRRMSGQGEIYKDFSKGYYLLVDEAIGKDLGVREHFDEIYDWRVIPNSDTTIYGFQCKQATTLYDGYLTTAWFAESIPVLDGPGRFAGLPGLILKLKNNFGIIEVANIQIINASSEEIVIPVREKYVSFKDFKESRTLTVRGKRAKKE